MGSFTFRIVNGLGAVYPDDQVYWAVIGLNANNNYFYLQADGTQVVMTEADNNTEFGGNTATNCNGGYTFADYSQTIATMPSVTVPEGSYINSARIWISLGSWLPFCINSVDGNGNATGIAPPSVTNPSLQGNNVPCAFVEFAYNTDGSGTLNINTSSVDFMDFPVNLDLMQSGSSAQSVSTPTPLDQIVTAFQNCADANFANLVLPLTDTNGNAFSRILSVEHACSGNGYTPPATLGIPASTVTYFTSFYDAYISYCWTQYTTSPLTIYISGTPFTGQVQSDNNFYFWSGTSVGTAGSQMLEQPVPQTWEVMMCQGSLANGDSDQKNIQKFIAAAIYRGVFHLTPAETCNSWGSEATQALYYTGPALGNGSTAPVNYYSLILHQNSSKLPAVTECGTSVKLVNGVCYAFGYDDVCNQSPSLASTIATDVVITLPNWKYVIS